MMGIDRDYFNDALIECEEYPGDTLSIIMAVFVSDEEMGIPAGITDSPAPAGEWEAYRIYSGPKDTLIPWLLDLGEDMDWGVYYA